MPRKSPHADRDQMTRVITDAAILGNEHAAKKHGIAERSVQRYKNRCAQDPELAAMVAAKKKKIDDDWRDEAVSFLRTAVAKLEKLVATATGEQIREVAGAIKIVGELTVARDALVSDEQQPRTDSARAAAEEDSEGREAPSGDAPVH
jgi:hypothetical protein